MSAEGVLAKPALKITMPKSMAFVFNPYGLKVADAKGTINASSENTATLLGSYKFDTTTGADTSGWVITNATGADVKAAVYAYSVDKDATTFSVQNKDYTAPASGAPKRYVKVALKAKADALDAVDVALQKTKLDTKTASIWDTANNSVVVDKVESKLVISFDEENCSATKDAKDTWTEKDAVKIDFIFGFELADGGSAGGGSSSSFTGAAYTITWKKNNTSVSALSSTDDTEVAEDTETDTGDFPTIATAKSGYTTTIAKYVVASTTGEAFDDDEFTSASALKTALDEAREDVEITIYGAAE